MPTPYTTKSGVQIGRAYVPTARPYHDRDALRLQRALLGEREPIDWDGIGIVAFVLAVIMAVIVYAIGGAA